MPRKFSVIGNQVAQRILLSFVLAALIPVVALGLLSFEQVNSQLRDQTDKALHKSCKDYAMGLADRISLFESALRLLATGVQKSETGFRLIVPGQQSRFERQFAHLAVILPPAKNYPLTNDRQPILELTAQEIAAISSGKPLVKSVSEASQSRVWMAVSLVEQHPERGILIAELNPEMLWGAENIDTDHAWVLDKDGGLLFALEPGVEPPSDLSQRIQRDNSGPYAWKSLDQSYVGAFWKLPLNNIFVGADWVIVQDMAEARAFAATQQFSTIYPPVIALVVLIIGYLSSKLISKYLAPLQRLKSATEKIADGDFNCRVDVDSHDEFETLADSFNEMSRRLRSQFDILSTMAEIDRNILSALNADEIVETALSRLPDILLCDWISIARIDASSHSFGDIRSRLGGQYSQIQAEHIQLSAEEVGELLAISDGMRELAPGAPLPAYLQLLALGDDWQCVIVPVCLNGNLSAIISLGYPALKPIPVESRGAARNFADRIAVALSNAAWEEKLFHQAHYDALTGLPNRLVLQDRLSQEMIRAQRDNTQLALFFIDLDRFKNVNDSLGHSAGDELLTQVARIFLKCVRATDLVVRLGGDEFVVVIADLHSHDTTMTYVGGIAEKILSALNQTLTVAGLPMTVSGSLGIAVFPGDADNSQDLLKNADAAMYHAKSEGRANFRFYSPKLNATALENIKLEHELRGAIAKHELVVFYQPKVDLAGQVIGAEALIRWRHSEHGMVSPGVFIPLAEQTGLIVEIGGWVLEQTCQLLTSLPLRGLLPVRISVNLSAIEFRHPDLLEKIADILARTGVNTDFVELELTESVAIGDTTSCVERMNRLKGLGLKLAMDDFGTGFSSLSYLKELPLDVLKIDQSFVRHLETQENSQAIVKAIIALADGLGMETIAEGVETQAQVDFLKQNHCSHFQGFFFSRPLPAEDFLQLLTNDPRGVEQGLGAI